MSEETDEYRKKNQHYGFRHVPVVDENDNLVGMLSDRDLMALRDNTHFEKPVSEFMSHELFASRPNTPIKEVAGVMIFEKIHALPITTTDEKVMGIVTSSDILRALWRNAPIETWA